MKLNKGTMKDMEREAVRLEKGAVRLEKDAETLGQEAKALRDILMLCETQGDVGVQALTSEGKRSAKGNGANNEVSVALVRTQEEGAIVPFRTKRRTSAQWSEAMDQVRSVLFLHQPRTTGQLQDALVKEGFLTDSEYHRTVLRQRLDQDGRFKRIGKSQWFFAEFDEKLLDGAKGVGEDVVWRNGAGAAEAVSVNGLIANQ